MQVLFDVDMEVDEGEIVALMGTNGAGKSTLLRAMSGLVPASAGAVVFDGRDMTYTPPNEVAMRRVSQVPGGQGVFTQLSVGDNLRLAAWIDRRDKAEVKAATARVLEIFPALAQRLDEPAGNLSGGQQQMLTLGMAFISKPRLLMIDELSLGLAPAIVAQLLEMVRALRDQGVTIILVEQSVNVALTVADRAYFMEKGEIRFEGPTADLLDRPDLLRSVFLNAGQDSAAGDGEGAQGGGVGRARARSSTPPRSRDTVTTRAEAPVVLEVRDVSRRFGGVRALDDVSFDLHAGEILGFIGPERRRQDDAVRRRSAASRRPTAGRSACCRATTPSTCTTSPPTCARGWGWAARSRTGACSRGSPCRRPSPWRWSSTWRCATRSPPPSGSRRSTTRSTT